MEILDEKSMSKDKLKALELAEASREEDWTKPSFVAEIFQGRLRWDLIHPFPKQDPEDKKIGDAFLVKLEAFLKKELDPDEVDRTGEIPEKVMKGLKELGCFGFKIPKEYGGLGFSQMNYNRALHMVSSYCASTSVLLSAHQSIGVPQPLMLFGTDEQKKKYLPRYAKGEVSAFALTEPDVGSDPAKMKTMAEPSEDGEHYIINGEKLWCTNGVIAGSMIVMAQTPSKMVRGKERQQITAFIVEANWDGVEVAHRCKFMGLNGIQNGLIKFKNVKVPKENILLEEGKGLKIALTTLNTGRLTMPGGVTGCSKWCLNVVRKWASERTQWGHPVGEHEAISHKIATMAATTFAMEAVTNLTVSMADDKKTDIRLEAAMAKLFCTEASWKIIDGAVQIRGGRGYETGRSLKKRGEKGYSLERIMRDARINTIIEGTSQIMRLFIAREAMDMHVQKIMAVLSRRKTLAEKMKLGVEAFGFYALWYPKQWLPGGSTPNDGEVPHEIERHMKYATKMSKKLARNLFHAMMLNQQKLESKQRLMGRLVNVGTDLFAMAATCSRAMEMYNDNPSDVGPVELADLFCRQARGRIKKQFASLYTKDDAFANKIARRTMKGSYSWLEQGVILPED